ncbi:hypothetical protein [Salmonella enterica]|uniref:hypothetical protein n=1 Tax=Salmonella enterica TaxID=28901 RepID=UPI00107D99E6|nr:hypothetical protein [Salmonella enterica]EHQ9197653.1 hypothetical protein [Salmonella enterica subsp. diarizonae serovar 50:k:z:[z50],[z57],[z68], [z86]]EAA0681860.1 hypothetical protein [Salmonella enterica subsp. diarizonae]EAS3781465.1 hypothetical protein [Salmonella enterica]ECC3893758.1 hypothetical protein [Salmonella enterica subsp. diarizonae]ECC9622086.1 hypothetical protein [Salmonella enterica subsp. diarizonae]
MILVITSSFDKTIDYIIKKQNVNNFYVFNIDKFSEYQISYTKNGFEIRNQGHGIILESNCSSIYYRKPSPENLDDVIGVKYHNHCYREVFSLVEGIAEAFEGKCLSRPSILRKADNKILQAKTANEIGFLTPDYCLTNSPHLLTSYLNEDIIVKPLSNGVVEDEQHKEIVQTNLFDKSKSISTLKFCPAYFQKYSKKEYEVRITIVDEVLFSVKIESENKIDWRKSDNKIIYSRIDTPQAIKNKCLLYMKFFGIDFGCFDFIVFDDEWFFLEMNANGQWVWLEHETGLNISKEIMRYLNDK